MNGSSCANSSSLSLIIFAALGRDLSFNPGLFIVDFLLIDIPDLSTKLSNLRLLLMLCLRELPRDDFLLLKRLPGTFGSS